MSKILIVDDSMVIRKMINKSLDLAGHECHQAENGQEGFNTFLENTFDLVVTDINMPILDGFGLIEKIRTSDHAAKNLPIIVLSTEFSDDTKAKGRSLGVNAWMVKPTDDSVLQNAVAALIERAKA